MPKVSVIIPLYNQGIYLDECVNSVIAQTYKDFEIIVVDDCSTDGSGENADIEALWHKEVQVIHLAKNMGLSAARNTGIMVAKGKYILPLDADDKIAPIFLEKTYTAMEEGKGDIIYCDMKNFGITDSEWDSIDWDAEKLKTQNLMGCCSLFKKEDAMAVGGYDEEMRRGYEDWMFWLKLAHIGKKGYRIPEKLFFYRLRDDGMHISAQAAHAELTEQMRALHPEVF